MTPAFPVGTKLRYREYSYGYEAGYQYVGRWYQRIGVVCAPRVAFLSVAHCIDATTRGYGGASQVVRLVSEVRLEDILEVLSVPTRPVEPVVPPSHRDDWSGCLQWWRRLEALLNGNRNKPEEI